MSPWSARRSALRRFGVLVGQRLREQLSNTPALHVTDVPVSPQAITAQWLTAVLCAHTPGARVLDFHPVNGSSGTSTRQRLQLELNDTARAADIPQQLFTKSTPRLSQRVMMGFSGIIHGEIGFYPQLRPLLDIEAPRGYHACIDPASWRSMVLMEDVVATQAAKFYVHPAPVSRADMEALLANMARWHGTFWNSPALHAQRHWLRTPADFLATIAPLGFHLLARIGLQRARHVVPPALLKRTNDLWQALGRSLETNQLGPRTLLHGDPHIGQTYRTGSGNLGYADWQIVMQGGWAFDVAYAVSASLTIENRRIWENDLLRFYLDHLHASGGPALAFDTAWQSYRTQMIYPYFCWLLTIAGPVVPLLPDMQSDELSLAIIERTANAIADLESVRAI